MWLSSLKLLFGILSLSVHLSLALPQGCSCNGNISQKGSGECKTTHEGQQFCYVDQGQCQDQQESSQSGWFWSYQACGQGTRSILQEPNLRSGASSCSCNGNISQKGSGECKTNHEEKPFCYVNQGQCPDEQESSQSGWFWSKQACAPAPTCSCNGNLNSKGSGECKSEHQGQLFCYVNEGECPDEQESSQSGWFWSTQACAPEPRSTPQEPDLLNTGTSIGSNVPTEDCTCSDHVETDHQGEQTGNCLTQFRGSDWCYVASNSNCVDKKQSSKKSSLYWSNIACQANTDGESGVTVKMECGFDDNELVSLGRSAHDLSSDYVWSNGRIPVVFTRTVGRADKELFLRVMTKIESKTCFKFIKHNSPPTAEKYLEITVDDTPDNSCVKLSFKAWVTNKYLQSDNKMRLRSRYKLADKFICQNNQFMEKLFEGLILHEFFHVFGVGHTQSRKDRNAYIEVLLNNILDSSQYEICNRCKIYPQIPYECNSIMHYGSDTSRKPRAGPTMASRRSSCKINPGGSIVATVNDWKLLRIIADQVCDSGGSGGLKYLTSPNYPNSYPNNQDTTQTMSVPAGSSILVKFLDFQIEDHRSCRWDYVQICDANGNCEGKLCGSKTLVKDPLEITIETSTATVKFHSDGSVTQRGFKLSYQADPNAPALLDDLDAKIFEFNADGYISCTKFSDCPPGSACKTYIKEAVCFKCFILDPETGECDDKTSGGLPWTHHSAITGQQLLNSNRINGQCPHGSCPRDYVSRCCRRFWHHRGRFWGCPRYCN